MRERGGGRGWVTQCRAVRQQKGADTVQSCVRLDTAESCVRPNTAEGCADRNDVGRASTVQDRADGDRGKRQDQLDEAAEEGWDGTQSCTVYTAQGCVGQEGARRKAAACNQPVQRLPRGIVMKPVPALDSIITLHAIMII